jgi:hypothetical protein
VLACDVCVASGGRGGQNPSTWPISLVCQWAVVNGGKHPTTTDNNRQQQTTTDNNRQQQTTTDNNRQQQTTTDNNRQQQLT